MSQEENIPGLEIVEAKASALPQGSVEETARKLRDEQHTNSVSASVQVHGDDVVAG